MVCLLAAPWVHLSDSAGNGWPHNALRHHWLIPISCDFRDCKALLVTSLTHVNGAIASVQTFTFTFIKPQVVYCTVPRHLEPVHACSMPAIASRRVWHYRHRPLRYRHLSMKQELTWPRMISRSLEMILFDRSHKSSYWRFTVTMALSCTVCEIKRDVGRKSLIFL